MSVAETAEQVVVRVDATIAQERPDAAHVLAAREVDVGNEQLALVGARAREELALRPGDEARAPELDAAPAIGRRFKSGAVASEQRQAIGDGVAALHGDPRIALALLLVVGVVRIPADRGR